MNISTHLGRGKHTTRHVELITVGNGLVADTPGFSSLEFTDIEAEELTFCFPEIQKLSENVSFVVVYMFVNLNVRLRSSSE